MPSSVVARWSFLAVCVAAAGGAVGCGPAPGETTDEGASPLETPALFTNDKTAFDYFLGKGLTNFQAAGIVGNLDQESGVDPAAVQPGGPGRGIAQWSVGGRWDTDANDNATWYASQQKQNVDSLQLQLDFVWYELTTFSNYGLAALKASTDVSSATIAFQNDFEGCGACNQTQRIAYANAVLAAYGNDKVDGGVGSTGPDAGTGGPACMVPGLGAGECILTSDCMGMPGHVSTPGYCPGPANVECCTGPSGSGADGGPTGGDAGSAQGDGGAAQGGDAGAPSHEDAGGGSGAGDGGPGLAGDASPDAGGWTSGAAYAPGSNGCSIAPAPRAGARTWLGTCAMAIVWVVARRRRRAARRW